MKTCILFLMLITGITGFSQKCPCITAAVIGSDSAIESVHNNRVTAMKNVEITLGDSVKLTTLKSTGAVSWYRNKEKINNLSVTPVETTEFTVVSNLEGCPDAYDKVIVKVNTPLNEESNKSILIYPNPAKNRLTITSYSSTIRSIQIYSLNGSKLWKKYYKEKSSSQAVDISSLSAGTYSIAVELLNQTTISKKIIKQ